MAKAFYITTTLPYVNAAPHIGFALEIVTADTIARYQRLLGNEVVFNTGTDEHGQKIYQNALTQNKSVQKYVDEYAQKFADLRQALNLSYTNFIRTTDKQHQKAAQVFWQKCRKNGDIYKKHYQTKYCVGCEMEKTDSELVDGRCPLHPNQELELREEENYFFRFSRYQAKLEQLYQTQAEFVKPKGKFKEIKAFVQAGLKDFSISRLKTKMPWGIAVPDDKEHVMYVWFDALINYISTLGWPDNEKKFTKFWGTKTKPNAIQIAGKDNLRQQSAMWQAMLLSADLPPSKQILINGFISVNGQKMSKSLGNVIAPFEMVKRYGSDATRFLLLQLGPIGGDMDVSWQKFDTTYQSTLANGLGNLASRVAKLATTIKSTEKTQNKDKLFTELRAKKLAYFSAFDHYEIKNVINFINDKITAADKFLSLNKPWLDSDLATKKLKIETSIDQLIEIAILLQPLMPKTAENLLAHFQAKKIEALQPLFPRLSSSS